MKDPKTILVISIIIFSYFMFITNINYFFDDMDDQIISYKNNFKREEDKTSVIEKIIADTNPNPTTKEDLKQIASSPFLVNLISYLTGYNEEQTKSFLNYNADKLIIYTIILPEYDSKIIYINSDSDLIAFTLDGKNIIYNQYLSGESCVLSNVNEEETNLQNINHVAKWVNGLLLTKLKINQVSDFSITSVTHLSGEYRYSSGEVYEVEDANNHIKVTYSLECSSLYSLYVGFDL